MSFITSCYVLTDMLALPTVFLFFGAGVILSFKTDFIQLRSFSRFMRLLTTGVEARHRQSNLATISPMKALMTAMSTTIGIGNVVAPSIAIAIGGPGALFWMLVYSFFGAVVKYAEVTFAVHTRQKTKDGRVLGGPTQYLHWVTPFLGWWYGALTIFLFGAWSAIQTNTLSRILAHECVPTVWTGLVLAITTFLVLIGGAQRVGALASRVLPAMFMLYIVFAGFILFKDLSAVVNAFKLMVYYAFNPATGLTGFAGASVYMALKTGLYKGIFVTEAGVGTSAIPHALADVERGSDQGILAMYSIIADMILSLISGLIVLVTGAWYMCGANDILIYEAFCNNSPLIGKYILITTVSLFALTTIIGNSFNGSQSFASFTRNRHMLWYHAAVACGVYFGAQTQVPLIWALSEILLALVALPNLIGIIFLAYKYPAVLKD
jgi:AGCS family alanine or glycine:cation symporter